MSNIDFWTLPKNFGRFRAANMVRHGIESYVEDLVFNSPFCNTGQGSEVYGHVS